MGRIALPAACLLALAVASHAGGSPEKGGETSLEACLILAEKDAKADTNVTQTLLPQVVGLYAWSPFTVKEGVPRVSSDNTYSTMRRNGTSAGSIGANRVLVYDMAVVFTKQHAGISGKEIHLEFGLADLTTASGEVRWQPAVWAALEAARRSGRASGSLRVLEAVSSGTDGFRARVEIR